MHPIDTCRVAFAGLSAGARMAVLVGLHVTNRFAAVVMHSGVEPSSANSSTTALSAMRAAQALGRRYSRRAQDGSCGVGVCTEGVCKITYQVIHWVI